MFTSTKAQDSGHLKRWGEGPGLSPSSSWPQPLLALPGAAWETRVSSPSACLQKELAPAPQPIPRNAARPPRRCGSTSPIHLIHPLETNKQVHPQTNVSAPTAFPDGETLRPHEGLHHQVVQVAATQTVPTSLVAHPGFAGVGEVACQGSGSAPPWVP